MKKPTDKERLDWFSNRMKDDELEYYDSELEDWCQVVSMDHVDAAIRAERKRKGKP